VLFNTLTYAQFLAIVFVGAWLLVQRRLSLLLPWAALFLYAFRHPSVLAWGLTGLGAILSVSLLRLAQKTGSVSENAPPPPRLALLQLGLQVLALTFLTQKQWGLDPFSYALSQLNVPVRSLASGTWLVFTLGVFSTYHLLVARKIRLFFILIASYLFYAHWDYRFLPLIWASSTADWWLGNKIGACNDPLIKKRWLSGTVVLNLGVLGFFKYFNFGVESASQALETLGLSPLETSLRVALPVGISFFTFESMSYVIDVYRGELKPQKSYAEYLSFVAFFPHLVAGPIVRPRDLLPQLAGPARFNAIEWSEGLFLIAIGLSKKIVIGDYLALNLIDRVYDAPLMYSAVEVYAATIGYALQIYCDFSGYTDIAIGSALLLGIRFPLNFNSPYKAHNIVDFWRRWHISLSTWLRDYLYIPLGGNRGTKARTYFNLLATMILGGLWHGAAWTFVAWGTLHGGALAVNKWLQDARSIKAPEATAAPAFYSIRHICSVIFTVHLVCAGWIFFRAESFEKARLIYSQLTTFTTHHPNLPPSVLGILALGIFSHYVPDQLFCKMRNAFTQAPWFVQGFLLIVVAIVLRRLASSESVPFVYFQF